MTSDLTILNLREQGAQQKDLIASMRDRIRQLETQEWPYVSRFDFADPGDLVVGSGLGTYDLLPAGADGLALVADSTQALDIKWGQVGTAGIADLSITEPKIVNAAVTVHKIANLAVSGGKIALGTVTNDRLAPMAEGRVKGRVLGSGTGDPVDLSAFDLSAIVFSQTLGADWDLGAGRRILTDAIRARSASGLGLQDDGGNYGLFVEDSTGFVGVRTATPGAALHVLTGNGEGVRIHGAGVSGNASLAYLTFYDSNGSTRRGFFGDGSAGNTDIYLQADTGALRLRANGADVAYLASGQMAIGHTSPGALLDVAGNAIFGAAGAGVDVTFNGSAGSNRQLIFQTNGVSRWIFRGADATAEVGANAGSDFFINARADDGSHLSFPLYLRRANGQMGVGTSNPQARLHVNGGALIAGDDGGLASTLGLSNVSNTAANSTGVGTVLMKGATSRNSVGFIKLYNGTTVIWIPYWTTITG